LTGLNYEIVPSTLSFDQSKLADELADAQRAGADVLQWDVMDGAYVPNLTVGWDIIAACRPHVTVPFEAHLMIQDPGRYIDQFARAGNQRIIVHAEACTHLHRVVEQIRGEGCAAGVALNPATPVNVVEHVLDELDTLLIMTVNPGFGGQKFISAMLPKIRQAAAMIAERQLAVKIEVDGGIARETIRAVYDAGARKFVSGSAVASHPDGKAAAIRELRAALP
jgi:ribulose-phosphate 3-epimerase